MLISGRVCCRAGETQPPKSHIVVLCLQYDANKKWEFPHSYTHMHQPRSLYDLLSLLVFVGILGLPIYIWISFLCWTTKHTCPFWPVIWSHSYPYSWPKHSKISPTYPWKIPQTFPSSLWRNFFLCGGLGKFGVSSQGMWAKSWKTWSIGASTHMEGRVRGPTML